MSDKAYQKGVAIYLILVIVSVVITIGIGMTVLIIGQLKISKGLNKYYFLEGCFVSADKRKNKRIKLTNYENS